MRKLICFSRNIFIFFLILASSVTHSCQKAQSVKSVALVGGTLLDVSNKGHSKIDIEKSVILVQRDKIVSVGQKDLAPIPEDAQVIDVTGKFIVPGLIDGFAAINNQAYANAYLYMGVTSIIGVSGMRRGNLFTSGNPGPTIYSLETVGRNKCTDAELLQNIDKLATQGSKVSLLMYKMTPHQLELAVKKARELGLGTIGELGYSSYAEGIQAGIDVFVHTSRYSLDIAPAKMIEAVAKHPFSDDFDSPKWKYYKYLTNLDMNNPRLEAHAKRLARGQTFIMPTLSVLYLDMPDSKNPWKEPVAEILDPADINNPANKITGKHEFDESHQSAYTNLAKNLLNIEQLYKKTGANYLAGSATDVWGTMPGISLHTELELLHRIGLTEREAIAASTTNFASAFRWENTAQIKPGCRADILVLDENPLEDLQNLKKIHVLMLRGQLIDRESLINK